MQGYEIVREKPEFHDVPDTAGRIAIAEFTQERKRKVYRLPGNRYLIPASDEGVVGDIEIKSDDPEIVYFIMDYLVKEGLKLGGAKAWEFAKSLYDAAFGDDDNDDDDDGDDGGDGDGGGCITVTVRFKDGRTVMISDCPPTTQLA